MQDSTKSIQRLAEAIQSYHTKSSDTYSDFDQNDIENTNKISNDKQSWYDQTCDRFNGLKTHQDATILF